MYIIIQNGLMNPGIDQKRCFFISVSGHTVTGKTFPHRTGFVLHFMKRSHDGAGAASQKQRESLHCATYRTFTAAAVCQAHQKK